MVYRCIIEKSKLARSWWIQPLHLTRIYDVPCDMIRRRDASFSQTCLLSTDRDKIEQFVRAIWWQKNRLVPQSYVYVFTFSRHRLISSDLFFSLSILKVSTATSTYQNLSKLLFIICTNHHLNVKSANFKFLRKNYFLIIIIKYKKLWFNYLIYYLLLFIILFVFYYY